MIHTLFLISSRIRTKDKQDRATAEQVMDPRTRMILFKLLNRGVVLEINGCISTGKEANVYHATGKDGKNLAIKIYKTSILVFKDRDKYVSGEFRSDVFIEVCFIFACCFPSFTPILILLNFQVSQWILSEQPS